MTKINMDNPHSTDPKSKGQAEDCSIALLTIMTAHGYDGVLDSEWEQPRATNPS
jgi:hypothetical protein